MVEGSGGRQTSTEKVGESEQILEMRRTRRNFSTFSKDRRFLRTVDGKVNVRSIYTHWDEFGTAQD